MSEIEEIIDESGEVRRLGSLPVPEGFVSAFPVFEDTFTLWDEADILKRARDTNRKPRRLTFGASWIMDQRSVGSCNGWAGASAYARARYLRNIKDGKQFSGAFLYSLINGGRDAGSALEAGMREIQRTGVAEIQYAAWNAIYPHLWQMGARENAAKHKGLACFPCRTLHGFRTGLAMGHPGVCAVHFGSASQRIDQHGIAGVVNGPGNHAEVCQDIVERAGRLAYDTANSHGRGFGTDGYAYLVDDHFEQTIGKHQFYIIGSTQEME